MEYLVKWNRAKKAIAEAKSVDELKKIRNQAEAYRYALKQAGEAPEVVNMASEIKLRAERRAGEFLKKAEKQKPGEYQRSRGKIVASYKELGIDHNQAHRWQKMAVIPEEEFEEYIENNLKVPDGLSTAGALKMLNDLELNKRRTKKVVLPKGKYSLIYADPPWEYRIEKGARGLTKDQYPVMSLEDISNLDISNLTAEDCILFLWATSPLLEDAFSVINSWGFMYRTSIVWVKTESMGLGYYVRVNHELLLICKKGEHLTPAPKSRPDSVIYSKRRKHSQKPDEVYKIIEKMYPADKKIELFARNKRKGWSSWGNEV